MSFFMSLWVVNNKFASKKCRYSNEFTADFLVSRALLAKLMLTMWSNLC